METYAGIDYGLGKTNIDTNTGIRYGVIHSNRLASWAWDDITSQGVDMDYEDSRDELLSSLSFAIQSVLEERARNFDAKEIAESIVDDLEFDYESHGDCRRYRYVTKETEFGTCSDGDIFVVKSEFYALCQFCSPCAPGAGYLESEGGVKAYCLGPDWFDGAMPYKCFRVSDDSEVKA
jgi:hypothetical protein